MTNYIRSDLLKQNYKITHKFFNKNYQENFAERFIILDQIHSSDVVLVDRNFSGEKPKADALITQTPGLCIGVLTADCVPILLASKDGSVVAAVHAGWRGAVATIIENTLASMLSLGASDIVAALGPCIWQESYEISSEFYDQINAPSFFMRKPSGRWHFDLPAYVKAKLLKAGVSHVAPSMANTYSDDNFNSYRRVTHNPGQELKRNLSIIGINY